MQETQAIESPPSLQCTTHPPPLLPSPATDAPARTLSIKQYRELSNLPRAMLQTFPTQPLEELVSAVLSDAATNPRAVSSSHGPSSADNKRKTPTENAHADETREKASSPASLADFSSRVPSDAAELEKNGCHHDAHDGRVKKVLDTTATDASTADNSKNKKQKLADAHGEEAIADVIEKSINDVDGASTVIAGHDAASTHAPHPEVRTEEDTLSVLEAEHQSKGVSTLAMERALTELGYPSWNDFAREVAEKATQLRLQTRKRGKKTVQPGEVKIQDVVNKKSHVHHVAFTKAYHAAKKDLEKTASTKNKSLRLQHHTQLVPLWSDMTAAEHTWYLQHAGQRLVGSDVERFALLKERFEAEKKKFFEKTTELARQSNPQYNFLTDRQNAQIQDDLRTRRQRIRENVRQYYIFERIIPPAALVSVGGRGREPRFSFVKEAIRVGSPLHIRPLVSDGTSAPIREGKAASPCVLSADKLYLPACIAPLTESSSVLPREERGSDVYRKYCTAEIWDDARMQEVILAHNQSHAGKNMEIDGAGRTPVIAATAMALQFIMKSGMTQHTAAWELPVVVKNFDGSKVIYLGKPFLARKERIRDYQRRLHKYAVLSASQAQLHGHSDGVEHGSGIAEDHPTELQHMQSNTPTMSAVLQRECSYTEWSLDGHHSKGSTVFVRSNGAACLSLPYPGSGTLPPKTNDASFVQKEPRQESFLLQEKQQCDSGDNDIQWQRVVCAAKTEYFPLPDMEEYSLEELSSWYCKILLNAGTCGVYVSHVHALTNQVIDQRVMTMRDIEDQWGSLDPGEGVQYLAHVLHTAQEFDLGMYILSHTPTSGKVAVYKAVDDIAMGNPVTTKELSLMTIAETTEGGCDGEKKQSTSTVYDLYGAVSRFGEVDLLSDSFIPPKWRQFSKDIAQVPYTFPPRGMGEAAKREKVALKPRRRDKTWGGDLDRVEHVARISKAEYEAGLVEEL